MSEKQKIHQTCAVKILMRPNVLSALQAQSETLLGGKASGYLIGRIPEKQPDGRYLVYISDFVQVAGLAANNNGLNHHAQLNSQRLLEVYIGDYAHVVVGFYTLYSSHDITLTPEYTAVHKKLFSKKWGIQLHLNPACRLRQIYAWNSHLTELLAYDFPWPKWSAHIDESSRFD